MSLLASPTQQSPNANWTSWCLPLVFSFFFSLYSFRLLLLLLLLPLLVLLLMKIQDVQPISVSIAFTYSLYIASMYINASVYITPYNMRRSYAVCILCVVHTVPMYMAFSVCICHSCAVQNWNIELLSCKLTTVFATVNEKWGKKATPNTRTHA